ncbi:unnamed protein product [Diabrotica balteata]|uniref:Uncharacterized protein n=1 Tax=Diabrotica balteata TaxID=107213 RepID=A0A9N9STK4_DIABA|nr:unnamed protein product [Diabrotica balteata]
MNKITYYSQQYGLNINVKKTKLMIISKKRITEEIVTHYNYLGAIIKARSTFNRMGAFFRSLNLSLDTKVRMLRYYVFSVLFYGVKSWTLKDICRKLEAFEMWLYRRILKIPWTDRVTNEEVLKRMNQTREVLITIKSRKLQFFGHIMQNESRYALLQAILQGNIFGKHGLERRRTWLKNLRIWFNTISVQLYRAAAEKIKIAMMIDNIRN